MKGQMQNGLKAAGVLLLAATLGLAQRTPAAAPNGLLGNPARSDQSPAEQGMPGIINYVEGPASLNGEPLDARAAGHTVAQPNQTIQTQDGYVEVLLTPGAFLRIGHNSEVVPRSLGLANVQLQVVHGSAMIEAADLVKGTVMQVRMDDSTTQIDKRGLYEFEANQQLVRVLDGKASVLKADRVKTIGKGDQIALTDPKLKSHGFDKEVAEADPLYVWSRVRGEAEAQANEQVARNVEIYGGWYGPGWYWDPYWAGYAFLPGSGFLYSPFGWGFYSPGFIYAAPLYHGFHGYYGRLQHGHVGGVSAGVHSYRGFHGPTTFHNGGGFHGGGGRHR